jgi:hypothetical protein
VEKKEEVSELLVNEIMRHAEKDPNWKDHCAELLSSSEVSEEQITAAVMARRKEETDNRISGTISFLLVSYLPSALSLTMAPGFIWPFFNHPIGRMVVLAGLVWNLIGLVLVFRSRKKWQFVCETIIFGMPITLSPMLGPAVITLVQIFKYP